MGGSLQEGDPCLSFLVQPVGLCPSPTDKADALSGGDGGGSAPARGTRFPLVVRPYGLDLGCLLLSSAEQSRVPGTRAGLFLGVLTGASLFLGPFREARILGPAGPHMGRLGPRADGQKVLAQWYKTGYDLLNCEIELF